MFYTAVSSEIPIPAPIANPELRCWAAVRLAFQMPYFLVSFFTDGKPQNFGQNIITILCVDLGEVTAIAGEHEIAQLARLAPVGCAKQGEWRMEAISEIWVASEPGLEAEETAHVFVTDTDSRYVESDLDIDEAKLTNLRMIFPAPRNPGRGIPNRGAR
jgi:hypothetical protein